MADTKQIDQEVPKGKRLLFTDAEGNEREFHGPQRVVAQVSNLYPHVQLVDELPPAPDTRTDYEKLGIEQKFEGLREHLKVTEEQIVAQV